MTVPATERPLDARGRRLLELLRRNARESVSSLARQLHLSRTAVQERIRRLEERGIITGYTVTLGTPAQLPRLRAQVMVEVAPSQHKQVEASLSRMDAVRSLHTVSGQYDLIALVEAPDAEAMDELLDRIGAISGISKTLSSIILATKVDR